MGQTRAWPAEPPAAGLHRDVVVALMGQPNVGKSTVFNLLTGSAQRVGNWPGTTVARKDGACRTAGAELHVVDLPGTYSLTAGSEEERIARDFIVRERPDAVVVIADAAELERSLYLLSEVALLDVTVVVALNMMDVAAQHGIRIEPDVLEAALGVRVVPLVAVRGQGRPELLGAIAEALADPERFHPRRPAISPPHRQVLQSLQELLSPYVPEPYQAEWVAVKLLEGDEELISAVRRWLGPDRWGAVHDLLLAHEDAVVDVAGGRYEWIERMAQAAVVRPRAGPVTVTDRLDRAATHPLWGRLILVLVFGAVFAVTFVIGSPLQRWLDSSVLGAVSDLMRDWLAGAPSWLRDVLVEGVIGGAGRVITLVPVLILFFAAMAVVEESGYLARVAFLLDGMMHRIGLHGKSFFPLVIGFGCNVPAVMGSRVIESRRGRLLTILLTPLIPCTGRLAVVVFVAAVFFGAAAPLVAWALVVMNLAVLGLVGIAMSRWVVPGEQEPFIMVLPLYHRPALRSVARVATGNTWAFIRRAGTLIVAASVLMWVLASYPGPSPEDTILAAVGRGFGPMGHAMGMNWQLVAATLSGFVAKENAVATLGILFGANAGGGLGTTLAAAVTPASALAFLVVQMLFIPCVATVAAMRTETGGWRWPLISTGLLLVVALAGGVVAYQVARLIGAGV